MYREIFTGGKLKYRDVMYDSLNSLAFMSECMTLRMCVFCSLLRTCALCLKSNYSTLYSSQGEGFPALSVLSRVQVVHLLVWVWSIGMPVQTPMSLLFPPNPPPPLNGAVGLDQYSVSVAVSHIDTVGCVWVLLSDISVRTTDVYPSPVLGRQGSVDVLLIFFLVAFFSTWV